MSSIRVFLLFLFPAFLAAQSPEATISGVVSDSQGAVIPNVEVVAISVERGVRTTTQVPATMAFLDIDPQQRARMNISDGMIRVSAGLEDVEDLIADFDAALEQI